MAATVVGGTLPLLLRRRVSTSNSSESGKRREAISRRGDGGCSMGNLIGNRWIEVVSTIGRSGCFSIASPSFSSPCSTLASRLRVDDLGATESVATTTLRFDLPADLLPEPLRRTDYDSFRALGTSTILSS